MKISELQQALEEIKQKHGDRPCFAYGRGCLNPTEVEIEFRTWEFHVIPYEGVYFSAD